MNTVKKEFLNDCPIAFQQLHAVFGFDFCAEYHMEKVNGKYTVNSLLKTAEASGCVLGVDLLIAATKLPTGVYDDYHVFQFFAPGKIWIDFRFPGWNGLDNFGRKCDVDDVRKRTDAETVLIWQNMNALHKPKQNNVDFEQRFRVVEPHYSYGWHSPRYISSIDLRRTDSKGEEITIGSSWYDIHYPLHNYGDLKSIIDKSGYLLVHRRDEWERRAKALRAERAKAAYTATNTTEKVNGLYRELMAYKTEIAAALMNATTYAEVKNVHSALDKYRGLVSLMRDYETFKQRSETKNYASIEDSDAAYNRILNDLNNLRGCNDNAA